jgi:Tol biopolymer transport system component
MNRLLVLLAVTVLTAGLQITSAQQTAAHAEKLLASAQHKATIEGDLKGAIEDYKKIVAGAGSDRALAARALIEMAQCHQKLGDAEARLIYQRIVRDYADQIDAVKSARARLGGAEPPVAAARGDRAVWTGRHVDLFGTISPDGHFLSYVDWFGMNNVMVRDLVAGTSRALTPNATFGQFGYGSWSAISRDGEQLAYEWQRLDRVHEVRVASLRASGVPPARTIRTFDNASVRPFDWSPDGKLLAVLVEELGGGSSQIGIVSVQDGALRTLKSIDWRGVNKIVFSPDGRFIAYDLIADPPDRTRIHVMAVDASRDTVVVDDVSTNNVLAWSPDGYLVFSSDRSGQRAVWVLRVGDGGAKDTPQLVKDHIGSTWSLGLTTTGTLYVWQPASASYVRVAPVDSQSGKLLESGEGSFNQFVESRGRPSWSGDGKHLVFISCGPIGGGPCGLFMLSDQAAVARQIPHTLRYLAFPRSSPNGQSIVSNGTDLKGRQGIFLIDARTGATTLVTAFDRTARPRNPEWSPDGRSIRYQENRGRDVALLEMEIGADQPKEIFRTLSANTSPIRVSPDGHLAGFIRDDAATKSSTFVTVPMSGGAERVLFSAAGANALNWIHWQWTPDSQGVFVQKGDGAELPIEIWRVPVTGQARKLDVDARRWGAGFAVHPDGRQIAFAAYAGAPGAEVWALENFLPARSTKR